MDVTLTRATRRRRASSPRSSCARRSTPIASVQLARRQHPVDPGRPHRPVEPGRGRDGARPRRPARRGARARTSGSRAMQHPDGAWHAYYLGNEVEDPTLDTNVTCYVATGVWHHYLITGDTAFLRELWPTVERAIDFALDYQTRDRRDRVARRRPRPTARCSPARRASTTACAARSRSPSDSATTAPTGSCRSARSPSRSRTGPSGSSTRSAGRWTGTTRSSAACCAATRADARVALEWETFVVEGRGVRCVSDQPWVTAAETCELVMALDAIGEHEHARRAVRVGAVPARTTTAATGPA